MRFLQADAVYIFFLRLTDFRLFSERVHYAIFADDGIIALMMLRKDFGGISKTQ